MVVVPPYEMQDELADKPCTNEELPVAQIRIDPMYQRDLSPSKVKDISSKYFSPAFGSLIVNIRTEDGLPYAMDGQHRLAAARARNKQFVRCIVYRGFSLEEEARTFLFCNLARYNPQSLDTFRAEVIGKQPMVLAIIAIVERFGLAIPYQPGRGPRSIKNRTTTAIWAVDALKDIYVSGGEELLTQVLTLATRSWPDEAKALQAQVLKGIARFEKRYKDKDCYSHEEFIAKMKKTDMAELSRKARAYSETNGCGWYVGFSTALQQAFDKGRRVQNRLEPEFLND